MTDNRVERGLWSRIWSAGRIVRAVDRALGGDADLPRRHCRTRVDGRETQAAVWIVIHKRNNAVRRLGLFTGQVNVRAANIAGNPCTVPAPSVGADPGGLVS